MEKILSYIKNEKFKDSWIFDRAFSATGTSKSLTNLKNFILYLNDNHRLTHMPNQNDIMNYDYYIDGDYIGTFAFTYNDIINGISPKYNIGDVLISENGLRVVCKLPLLAYKEHMHYLFEICELGNCYQLIGQTKENYPFGDPYGINGSLNHELCCEIYLEKVTDLKILDNYPVLSIARENLIKGITDWNWSDYDIIPDDWFYKISNGLL